MFCTKCGNQLNESDKFCRVCGASFSQKPSVPSASTFNASPGYPQTVSQRKGIKKAIVITSIAIVVLVVGILAFSGGSKNKIAGRWKDKNDTVEFMKSGRFTANYYWLGGTYDISGNTIVMSSPLLGNETYTFSISGDTLTLSRSNGTSRTKMEFKKIK